MSSLSTETRTWRQRALVPGLLGLVVVVVVVSFVFVIWEWRQEETARAALDRAQTDSRNERKKAEDERKHLRASMADLDTERRKQADAADSARARIRELEQELQKAGQETAVQRRKYEHTVAGMALDNGLKLCEQGDTDRGRLWLARALEMAPQDAADLRGAILRNLGCWQRQPPEPQLKLPQADAVGIVTFSPNSKFLLVADKDNTAQIWEAASGKPVGLPLRHKGPITAALFTPDGKYVVTASEDDTVRTWDAASGKPAAEPMPHSNAVTALAIGKTAGKDGKLLVASAFGKSAHVWELHGERKLLHTFEHEGPVTCLALSRDSQFLLVGTGGEERGARLWDVTSGKLRGRMDHYDRITAVAFSPDGVKMITASVDKTAQLWDTYTCRRLTLKPLPHEELVSAVAFSPDSKTVATGSWDKTARLWNANLNPGQPLSPPLAHQQRITALAFSPDGQLLLTASVDKTARLWDAATGRAIGRPLPHDDAVTCAAFSPDGKTLATGCRDKNARLWTVPQPVEGTPQRLLLWVQTTTAKELDLTGVVHPLEPDEVQARTKELATLGGPPKL